MEWLELVEKLSNAPGAPGFEDEVNEVIREFCSARYRIEEDAMRNLRIYRKNHDGNKPVVMLDAHSDEVAFMVQSINPNGTMNFLAMGAWHPQNVAAQKVKVRNRKGEWLTGIVASTPPHFMKGEAQTKLQEIDDMVIDLGANTREEVLFHYEVDLGAPIVPAVEFEFQKERGILFGKAFDNRLGCACVLQTLEALEGLNLPVDVVGAISVQEEIGGRGAKVNAKKIEPDFAVVFEGTPADDSFRDAPLAQSVLGKGPQIRHRDRSLVANFRVIQFAKSVASEKKISHQDAVRLGGGTNAGLIQMEHDAVPCLVLGTPTRYAHTPHCFANLCDLKQTAKWAEAIVRGLKKETIQGF